ncbi:hypothetical protein HLH33_15710 [Gluconacetobacter diazotrophicus]|uniref:PD(D/E)XK endonuclease domain-containing protein n=1 Tax=Gluconacetobacter diazotrophicus TaxID=33996 RepID=A0A7W4I7I9_GLUDI|nr:hypothetical protein [Gluconacetobacter diazotrophicus]
MLRERIVEHVLVGEILRTLWRWGVTDVEVLRSEFDGFGYDLVLSRAGKVRYIQFKTGRRARPGAVPIALSLAAKPGGCVLWIAVTEQLELGPFWWFGGPPGAPLPAIAAYPVPQRQGRRADGNRPPRSNYREVPAAAFRRLATIDAVVEALFGPIERQAPPQVPDASADVS